MTIEESDADVELKEGMPVTSEDGQSLGRLASMLVAEGDDEDEEAEFLLVESAGQDRLVPMEAVLGVGDGALILDVPATAMGKFPHIRADADPTDDEIEMAYRVYDEHAQYETADDEEEEEK